MTLGRHFLLTLLAILTAALATSQAAETFQGKATINGRKADYSLTLRGSKLSGTVYRKGSGVIVQGRLRKSGGFTLRAVYPVGATGRIKGKKDQEGLHAEGKLVSAAGKTLRVQLLAKLPGDGIWRDVDYSFAGDYLYSFWEPAPGVPTYRIRVNISKRPGQKYVYDTRVFFDNRIFDNFYMDAVVFLREENASWHVNERAWMRDISINFLVEEYPKDPSYAVYSLSVGFNTIYGGRAVFRRSGIRLPVQ